MWLRSSWRFDPIDILVEAPCSFEGDDLREIIVVYGGDGSFDVLRVNGCRLDHQSTADNIIS